MDNFIRFLKSTMETPTPFSPFHLMFFGITIVLSVLLVIFFKDAKDKTIRIIVGIFLIVMVILEIIKQIIFGYNLEEHVFRLDWSSFPFQFCSSPYYLYPLLVFLPESKFRKTLIAFCATFVFFGGFGYFFFPVSFCGYVFINIQTMVHHGSMIVVGVLLLENKRNEITYKEVLKSLYMLAGLIVIAIGLNLMVYAISPTTYINLFELNPVIPTSAAVFSDIRNALGYPMLLIIYVIGFLAFASIVFFAAKGIQKLESLISKKA